ncbi:MAG: 50S ribosomal protein L9 [Chloroflexota bacterium]|jgi:large subunit ribosomal protein L9|nr:50S ribosomal protein L9 [Chloroflexota bacterium]
MARTKVLLVQDVLDLGEAGDVRVVAGGYARNYLMPRGLAILATKGALKQAEEIRQAGIRRRARERAHAESQAAVVRGQRLLFEARAGENERLYGSVTAHEIADKLSEAVGFEVDRRRIQLEHPLRELGIHALDLRFMADVSAEFQVAVVREGETWAAAEARAAAKAKAQAEKEAADAAARAAAEAEEAAEEEAEAEEAEEE